jgi:hypothetical protein
MRQSVTKTTFGMPDPARSRRYCISRTRNVLIKAHTTMGELGNTLPPDLMRINIEIFRAWQRIKELIDILDESKTGSAA